MSLRLKSHVKVLVLLLLYVSVVRGQERNNDEIIETITTTSQPQVIQSVPLRDGQLQAEVTVYPCTDIGDGVEASYERLDIRNMETEEKQFVTEQVIYCGGLGAYGLASVFWSPTSDYLYYTDAREGHPDGFVLEWVRPVWRIQLETMEIERLGSAKFAMTGDWVAKWDQSHISLINIETDKRTDFPLLLEHLQVLSVTWLPDASGVVYIMVDAQSPFDSSLDMIAFINIETMEQTLLLQEEANDE